MADSYIQLPDDSVGKKTRTFERTVGANDVHEHMMQLVDPSTGDPIGSTADPVPISFTDPSLEVTQSEPWNVVLNALYVSVNYNYGGTTVSTTAVKISNALTIDCMEVSNHGPGILYLGFDNAVTTSGAKRGIPVYPGGNWSTPSLIKPSNTIYGIYSEAAASQNVSYMVYGTFPD